MVALNKDKYVNKVKKFLSSDNSELIRRDPTDKCQNIVEKVIQRNHLLL